MSISGECDDNGGDGGDDDDDGGCSDGDNVCVVCVAIASASICILSKHSTAFSHNAVVGRVPARENLPPAPLAAPPPILPATRRSRTYLTTCDVATSQTLTQPQPHTATVSHSHGLILHSLVIIPRNPSRPARTSHQ